MKKLMMVGAVAVTVALLFLLTPNSLAGASSSDFQMDGSTLVKYTGTSSNVSIPDTVEVIGRSAFEDNDRIVKVTIPNSVETIEEYAFWGCSSLETVVFGEGLKEVADFTFTACESLKTVTISDSIQRIGIMAFADCSGLTDIYIPPTVTDIHETAFDGVYYLNISAEMYSYPYNYAIERGDAIANVPEYLKATPEPTPTPQPVEPTPIPSPTPTPVPGVVIGSTSIVGNNAVVFMDSEEMKAAKGYEGLESIMQGGASQGGDVAAKEPVSIEAWAYYGDTSLMNMELATNVYEIGSFAFARSTIQNITLPEGLETIEYAAFYYCENLEDITIPDTVTYVGSKAFEFTPWLKSFYDGSMMLEENSDFLIVGDGVLIAYRGNSDMVMIPEGVKYIAPEAFLNHTEINRVIMPATIIHVDEKAFEGCNYKPTA